MGPGATVIPGAVLAGGSSRRMGRTKALIDIDGVPMAGRVATALAAGGCDDVAVIGGSSAELQPLGLRIVADMHPGAGPLGGVITALRHFATAPHVLVAACDLPMLDGAAVRDLLDAARSHPGSDVVVAYTNRIEPTLAVWNRTSVDAVVTMFDEGTRAVEKALARLDTRLVHLPSTALLNVNWPADVPGSSQ